MPPAVTHLLVRLGSAAVADQGVAALLFPLLQHATNLGASVWAVQCRSCFSRLQPFPSLVHLSFLSLPTSCTPFTLRSLSSPATPPCAGSPDSEPLVDDGLRLWTAVLATSEQLPAPLQVALLGSCVCTEAEWAIGEPDATACCRHVTFQWLYFRNRCRAPLPTPGRSCLCSGCRPSCGVGRTTHPA